MSSDWLDQEHEGDVRWPTRDMLQIKKVAAIL